MDVFQAYNICCFGLFYYFVTLFYKWEGDEIME